MCSASRDDNRVVKRHTRTQTTARRGSMEVSRRGEIGGRKPRRWGHSRQMDGDSMTRRGMCGNGPAQPFMKTTVAPNKNAPKKMQIQLWLYGVARGMTALSGCVLPPAARVARMPASATSTRAFGSPERYNVLTFVLVDMRKSYNHLVDCRGANS